MTKEINQKYTDELDLLSSQLTESFESHVRPIITQIWALTDQIDDESEADGTTHDHLTALLKYMGVIEKYFYYMRNKIMSMVAPK